MSLQLQPPSKGDEDDVWVTSEGEPRTEDMLG